MQTSIYLNAEHTTQKRTSPFTIHLALAQQGQVTSAVSSAHQQQAGSFQDNRIFFPLPQVTLQSTQWSYSDPSTSLSSLM